MYTPLEIFALCSAAAAAYFAAERRGRSRAWAVLAFFLSPALLVLVCLPKTNEAEAPKRWFAAPLEIVGVLSVLTMLGLIVYTVTQTGTFGGVPKCDSAFTVNIAKQAFAGAPVGKLTGLSIVELENIQETSASATGRECKGTALLNNATGHPAVFDIKQHGVEWFVSIRLPDL